MQDDLPRSGGGHAHPPAILVMGVSGSGKTTIGSALAARLGYRFQDADDLHPPGNRAKLAAGVPLTDADRAPWLDAVGAWLAAARAGGDGAVVACSALKRRYRERLQAAAPGMRIVHLDLPRDVLAQRMAHRRGHFMARSLLDDQLATLEPPGEDEGAIRVRPLGPVAETVAGLVAALATDGSG
ncbi:gluconokinase [Coralloluteibacterium thermophilus]|uniref:Gluconokinase n=1 Tax=Coralloluteibacterium thermophilum TaxID=2707049 RepID=A0ABV9NRB9_9GAMM